MDDLGTYQPFATPEDWATYARRDLSAVDTATITQLLESASREVREFCGWQIWPQLADDVLTIDGRGASVQVLPVRRLTAVTSVVEDGTALAEGTNFEWSELGILRRIDGALWTGRYRGIVATCTHGYVSSPADLRDMVCAMVGRAYASPLGELSASAGAASATYSRAIGGGEMASGGVRLLGGERDALARYRAGGVA